MGTKYAPLVEDLFCFVMRETSCCLSNDNEAYVIEESLQP